MRILAVLALAGLSAGALAQDVRVDSPAPVARFEIVKDSRANGPSSRQAPILDSITVRYAVRAPNGVLYDLVPDFHFHAPNGNAIVLHRELVETNGALAQTQITNATINIPPEGQKAGATISGGWRCGVPVYHATLRATILDADGNRSNSITYTIHCNGG